MWNDDHWRWLVEHGRRTNQNGLDLFERLIFVLSDDAIADLAVLAWLFGAQTLELHRILALHVDRTEQNHRWLIG